MSNIVLANFQIKAIGDLMEAMATNKRDIVLKSCTGSGKTIILTHFMDEWCKGNAKSVFVWLTPGKGNLEEQSKEKMDKYIHGSQTKLLSDVMTSGFEENDFCFINWEMLTKKGNNALKDSERTNFIEYIEKAHDNGLQFYIIVDESHQNDTLKSADILTYFKTDKIIRCSATPKGFTDAILIDIPEEDVIAEGLIKKMLIINQDFEQNISVENQIAYLLDKALDKQRELHSEFLKRGSDINPLIVVQIPNKSEVLQDNVELYLESKQITYENGQLAVWLSNKKQNLEEIEEPNATPIAVIIKQAIATGWDCPRAHILVKLRDNMSETFEIQTIGRIRRMPEAKHYESDLLDSCYLYTLDDKFTEGVKLNMGKGALSAAVLRLKPQYRSITIKSQQKTSVPVPRDAVHSLRTIYSYYTNVYNTSSKTLENKTRLQTAGYIFSSNIIKQTYSGEMHTLAQSEIDDLNRINFMEELNTHTHGRNYHQKVGEIGVKIGLEYNQINTIIRRLFDRNIKYDKKILALDTKDVYAFVLNNVSRLKHDIQGAMAMILQHQQLDLTRVTTVDFAIPNEVLFTFSSTSKTQSIMEKSVYDGYLSSAQPRSSSETKFEKYCEASSKVQWVYKNGDKGSEYFSIVYQDGFGKQKSFYPDYIVGTAEGMWIIETKGGFDRTGKSEDIDLFSPRKFDVLKEYLSSQKLKGGFVREDKLSQELCICMNNYNDDITSDSWVLLSEVL